MNLVPCYRSLGGLAAAALLLLASACSALRPAPAPDRSFYALDVDLQARPAGAAAAPMAAAMATPGTITLIVAPPQAAPGFDSQRLIYTRQAHRLDYFAYSEWVDTPARMLAPLIVRAVGQRGGFASVAPSSSTTVADLRLDTQVLRLQHEFGAFPSRLHFTLRATLVDTASGRVRRWREFDAVVAAASDDAYGGVVAANEAVGRVLAQLADFCVVGKD